MTPSNSRNQLVGADPEVQRAVGLMRLEYPNAMNPADFHPEQGRNQFEHVPRNQSKAEEGTSREENFIDTKLKRVLAINLPQR